MSLTGAPNRKDAREDLASNISTEITDLQTVYDYMPKDYEGESPVCVVQSGPVDYSLQTEPNKQTFNFYVSFWLRVDGASGSGLTSEDAEDALDNFAQDLADVLLDHYQNPDWIGDSEQFDEIIDGVPYSAEMHLIRLDWWE